MAVSVQGQYDHVEISSYPKRVMQRGSDPDLEMPEERLKAARIAAGFRSAAQAAKHMRISEVTYRAHENGQNRFGYEDALLYAKTFSSDADFLLRGKGAPPSNTHIAVDRGVALQAITEGLRIAREERSVSLSTIADIVLEAFRAPPVDPSVTDPEVSARIYVGVRARGSSAR